jgi:hypothetical protein
MSLAYSSSFAKKSDSVFAAFFATNSDSVFAAHSPKESDSLISALFPKEYYLIFAAERRWLHQGVVQQCLYHKKKQVLLALLTTAYPYHRPRGCKIKAL